MTAEGTVGAPTCFLQMKSCAPKSILLHAPGNPVRYTRPWLQEKLGSNEEEEKVGANVEKLAVSWLAKWIDRIGRIFSLLFLFSSLSIFLPLFLFSFFLTFVLSLLSKSF
jgi:hypothetical protein